MLHLQSKQQQEREYMKTKKVQRLSAETIAENLRKVASDWATRADYLMLEDGVNRKTWCACVYQMMEALDEQSFADESEFDKLAFLDNAGFFKVADHESMADWTYCTKREDYLDED